MAVLFALRPLPLSCAPLQVVTFLLLLWMCTTVQQGHGRRLSSAWHALGLQLHLSGTWLCSLGVQESVRCCLGRGERGDLFIVACVFYVLRVLRYYGSVCPATASSLMCATAGGGFSNVTDVYNVATGAWSTAQLSVARYGLAAASVGNVALFAGGDSAGVLLCMEGGLGFDSLLLRACFLCFARAAVLRFCLPCDRFLSHARHCRWLFQCCGCVQRYNRKMDDGSAQRGALCFCSCICRERGFVRWGSHTRCVVLLCREGGVEGIDYCCVRVLCFARAAVLRFCLPCDRFLSHARHCRHYVY
jgi:hypothetical protein